MGVSVSQNKRLIYSVINYIGHVICTLSLLGVSPSDAKIGGPSGCTLFDKPAFWNIIKNNEYIYFIIKESFSY